MRWLEGKDQGRELIVAFETHLSLCCPAEHSGHRLQTTWGMFQLGWKSS